MRTAAGAEVMTGHRMILNAVSLIDLPGELPAPVLDTCRLIQRTKLVVKRQSAYNMPPRLNQWIALIRQAIKMVISSLGLLDSM